MNKNDIFIIQTKDGDWNIMSDFSGYALTLEDAIECVRRGQTSGWDRERGIKHEYIVILESVPEFERESHGKAIRQRWAVYPLDREELNPTLSNDEQVAQITKYDTSQPYWKEQ